MSSQIRTNTQEETLTVISNSQAADSRVQAERGDGTQAAETTDDQSSSQSSVPPLFIINMDLPPQARWREVAEHGLPHFPNVVALFDEILDGLPKPFNTILKLTLPYLMRSAHSEEETEEMRGIATVAGVPLHLVLALNTFLDAMMGCKSGTVPVHSAKTPSPNAKLVHFRALDWEMEALRPLVVQVEYTRKGKTIARGITYAGYVGVLTGVRKGLSLSLNYRAEPSLRPWRLRLHQILVVLGYRRSISSVLRHYLLLTETTNRPISLDRLERELERERTTACYLTLTDGRRSVILEKDLDTAVIVLPHHFSTDRPTTVTDSDPRANSTNAASAVPPPPPPPPPPFASDNALGFIVVTNHDNASHSLPQEEILARALPNTGPLSLLQREEMGWVLEDSKNRRCIMEEMWRETRSNYLNNNNNNNNNDDDDGESVERGSVQLADVQNWMETWPIMNEFTHFACIMDPVEGTISWVKWWKHPGKPPISVQPGGSRVANRVTRDDL